MATGTRSIVAVAALSAVTGGVAGAVLLGAAIGGAAGFISGSVTGAIGAAINGEDVFDGFANGALTGAVIGGISGALSVFASGIGGTGAAVLANTGSIALTAGKVAAGVIGAAYLFSEWKRGSWPGDDPTISPGDGFEWRGHGKPGSDKGAWYNLSTRDSLHPDLNHPAGIEPHWDYVNKILKIFMRIFRDY